MRVPLSIDVYSPQEVLASVSYEVLKKELQKQIDDQDDLSHVQHALSALDQADVKHFSDKIRRTNNALAKLALTTPIDSRTLFKPPGKKDFSPKLLNFRNLCRGFGLNLDTFQGLHFKYRIKNFTKEHGGVLNSPNSLRILIVLAFMNPKIYDLLSPPSENTSSATSSTYSHAITRPSSSSSSSAAQATAFPFPHATQDTVQTFPAHISSSLGAFASSSLPSSAQTLRPPSHPVLNPQKKRPLSSSSSSQDPDTAPPATKRLKTTETQAASSSKS